MAGNDIREDTDFLERVQRLKNISQNLDVILAEIQRKEDEIKKAVRNLEAYEDQDRKVHFNDIFYKTYEELKGQHLPEKYRDIIALSEQGYSPEKIAKKLDLGIRETRLILRLYKGKRSGEDG